MLVLGVASVAGCATEGRCGAELVPLPTSPAYAVVLSDYSSSAIALLDADGEVLDPAWVTSGSHAPLLVTPVSGDVVLPRAGLGGGRLSWIDRYSVDVLTVVAMPGGAVVTQEDLRGDREGMRTGFSPNPQDALTLPDGRILVSRHNPNLDPSGADITRGNDLVAIDLTTHTMEHVETGCDGATYYARPADLTRVTFGEEHVIVVGLVRADGAFESLGPGAVAVLDEATLTPRGCVDLSPFANCGSVVVEPDARDRAVVLCVGDTFAGASSRRARAGLVELELGPDGLLETARVGVGETDPVPASGLVAIGGGRVIAVSDPRGDEDGYPDRLLAIDVAAGSITVVHEAEQPWTLGLGTATGDLLLVPEAAGAVMRFDVSGALPVLRDRVVVGGCSGLAPRQVAPLGGDTP